MLLQHVEHLGRALSQTTLHTLRQPHTPHTGPYPQSGEYLPRPCALWSLATSRHFHCILLRAYKFKLDEVVEFFLATISADGFATTDLELAMQTELCFWRRSKLQVGSRVRALKKPVAVEVNGGGNGLISMKVALDLWEGISE